MAPNISAIVVIVVAFSSGAASQVLPEPEAVPPPPPVPAAVPMLPSPPAPAAVTCPVNSLQLGVCGNLLNGVVTIGRPRQPGKPCCSVLGGLLGLEAAACLCTALQVNFLGVDVKMPIDVSILLNNCGMQIPPDYRCP